MNKVWVNLAKRRYYRTVLQCDLLGHWTLTRSWGSLDSNRGRVQHEIVDSKEAGELRQKVIDKVRIYRGYQLTHRADDFS
jgi:hypothetical protein